VLILCAVDVLASVMYRLMGDVCLANGGCVPSVMYLLRLYCCNFQHFVALPMDKMRVDLTSIVRYIFLELDFYLKF